MISNTIIPARAAPALHEIERGMQLKKCRKCGCMGDALASAGGAFSSAEEPEVRALVATIAEFKTRMEPIAYDCIGCKKCWGADATVQLANRFDDVEVDACGEETCNSKPAPANGSSPESTWPPYPGEYIVGNRDGSVAVCTLSNRDLARPLIASGEPHIAIAGRCDTENIGIEKVVLNLISNANVRWLILCGTEAQGHRAADAFLQLKERGVDADMRVLESASWRPVLKNLTLLAVARFREQIGILNLINVSDPERILKAVCECAAKSVPALPIREEHVTSPLQFEQITARPAKGLRLDKAGFFIVLPRRVTGEIICEHYENSGRLAHVISGRQAAVIASTAVERGFVTQLDHAAYLGRELAKAETALKTGIEYEQDAALGTLSPPKDSSGDSSE
jgi:tetrahydromethanopterin S-methyltransferase subunit A